MRMTQQEYDTYIGGRAGVTPVERAVVSRALLPMEDGEQAAIAQLLDLLGLKWCHVPNGGDRDVRVAAKLKAHGVKPGVPDILIFDTPPKYPSARGAAIELKRRRGGTVSKEQGEWLEYLENQGWCCCVARGWEEARSFLIDLGWRL